MAVVLDTGALVAFDRGDRSVAALLEAARQRRDPLRTSSGCVAQSWRSGGPRQARLAVLLRAVDERALAPGASRQVGELCRRSALDDVVDAHVASLVADGDVVLTSDAEDLRGLLRAQGTSAEVRRC